MKEKLRIADCGLRNSIRAAAAAGDAGEARAILAAALKPAADVDTLRAAFEKDMRPVRDAIISALEAGDMEALRGLRALLPHLLAEVNAAPALADVLALQLGRALVEGLNGKPEGAR